MSVTRAIHTKIRRNWTWVVVLLPLALALGGANLALSVRHLRNQVNDNVRAISRLNEFEQSVQQLGRFSIRSLGTSTEDKDGTSEAKLVAAYRTCRNNVELPHSSREAIEAMLNRVTALVDELRANQEDRSHLILSASNPYELAKVRLKLTDQAVTEIRLVVAGIRSHLAEISKELSIRWDTLIVIVFGSLLLTICVAALLVTYHRSLRDRISAEQTSRHKDEILAMFVEHVPAAVAMLDKDMRYLAVSRRWINDYGLTGRSIIGQSHYDVFPEIRNMPRWLEIHQRCLQGNTESCQEDSFVRTDGRVDWLRWEIHPWRTEHMEVGGIVMFTEVVNDQKEAAQIVRESELRFRTLATQCPVGIFLTDAKGDCIFVNEYWCKMSGLGASEGMVRGWTRALHPMDHDRLIRVWNEAIQERRTFCCDFRFLKPTGEIVWATARAVELRDEHGEITGYVGTIVNTTEEKCREVQSLDHKAKLDRITRLSIMGEMASGLAHELKQPLSAISAYAQACARLVTQSESTTLAEPIGKILQQVARASLVIDRIREFVQKGQLALEPVDLNRLAKHVSTSPELVMRNQNVSIRVETSQMALASADALQIEQVLLNLVHNSLDASLHSPHGHEVVIATAQKRRDEVEITVRDRGCGLSPQALEHLFEPFFTTKSTGMGMGLAISKSIIEAHGGRAWAENNLDGGASFSFTLPVSVGESNHAT